VQLAFDLDDAGPRRLAYLGRGQPDTGGLAHRFGQVVKQLVQVLAEAVYRLALQSQARIAEENDWSNAHRLEYTGDRNAAIRPSRGSPLDAP